MSTYMGLLFRVILRVFTCFKQKPDELPPPHPEIGPSCVGAGCKARR